MKAFSIAAPDVAFVQNRSPEWQSWFFTALGVLCFSFTFPMTRLSLRGFDPIWIALVRGAGAGVAALAYLMLSRSRTPDRRQMVRLVSAAVGMVVLFPIFVSIALKSVPATHASVLGSILPLATAVLYLTAVSQFIGFFFYYKGLALGGIAKMSQVQLLLPFVAIFAAHWVLDKQIDGSVIIGTLAITAIVAAGAASRRIGTRNGER